MSKKSKQNSRSDSPWRNAWKKFRKDKFALFGMAIIAFAFLIGFLGANIRPDQTEMAQQSSPNVNYKPPGFEITRLKERHNKGVDQPGFFGKLFFGGENFEFKYHAVSDYKIEGNYVKFHEYMDGDRKGDIEVKHLANMLYPLELDNKFISEGDKITFFCNRQRKSDQNPTRAPTRI